MKLLTLVGFLSLAACASNPNKAQTLDTQISYEAPVSNGVTIGVKHSEMITQKKVLMTEELRHAQNDAYELEARVYGGDRYLDNNGMWGVLRDCRVQESKVTKQLVPMAERRSYVIPEDDYKMGLDRDHNVIGLHEEMLTDRIERFKKYKEILSQREDEYQNKIDQCHVNESVAQK